MARTREITEPFKVNLDRDMARFADLVGPFQAARIARTMPMLCNVDTRGGQPLRADYWGGRTYRLSPED